MFERSLPRPTSAAHRGDFHRDVLSGMTVADVLAPDRRFFTFPRSTPLGDILHRLGGTHQNYFPITDDDGQMQGIFSLNDIREFMYDEAVWDIALAEDFAVTNVLSVTPQDDLNTAINRFAQKNIDELPVVAADNPGQLVGLLRRKDVIDAYNRRV